MIPRTALCISALCISVLGLLWCLSIPGCGGAPLVKAHLKQVGPWCGPNHRVQIGQRVVGHVAWGEKKWKIFFVDDAGKEHDPDKLAEQVWSYLERTGDAKRIKEAYRKESCYSSMTIVSINPLVVILETHEDADLRKQVGPVPDRYYWVAQVYALRDPPNNEGLQWFSPDLKQKPITLSFSEAGIAAIALANGTLKLIREGDHCKTTRE
jgi:hypothetical protein